MKNANFLLLPRLTTLLIFLNLLLSLNLIVSCQSEATEQFMEKPDSNLPATDRTCSLGYCQFTITASANVTLEFCGDITPSVSSCNFGCNTLSDDRYNVSEILQFNSVTYCVASAGSVCIRNLSTATSNAVLQVYFQGTSTPVNVTFPLAKSDVFIRNLPVRKQTADANKRLTHSNFDPMWNTRAQV